MDVDTPTAPKERFLVIDALRGFALFGVLAANLRDFSLFDLLSATARASLATARWDAVLEIVFAAAVNAKFMTIFTLLFGVGFALQLERAEERAGGMGRYLRRLLILLVIGLLHAYLLWWGDILRFYAVLGLLLVPLGRWRPRTLALAGVCVALLATPSLRPLMAALLPKIAPAAQENANALAAFAGHSLPRMWAANFQHDIWSRISAWGLPFYVLGRLLIGAALGKSGLLQRPAQHLRSWRRVVSTILPLGLVLTSFLILRDGGFIAPGAPWWGTETGRALVRTVRSAASLALGLGYVGAFVLLFERGRWQRWLRAFAPVGRMALTNYLMQTVLGLSLFYGCGLGLGPRFGLVGVVVACLVIFALQLALSRWWLARFAFGPAEWLWRSLTYGKLLSLRVAQAE